MALVSPGVQVTVIDESFYTPAEPGTTPLIVVATGQDKINGSGTGTAQGTLKANAGKAFRMTSQRDIVDFFGVPFFEKTPGNSPIHGAERNEYGLLAAYSFMGVSSSAFIVRADIDLNQLEGQPAAPGAEPKDGAWWFDTNDTVYGINEWNNAAISTTGGQKFSVKTPLHLTNDDAAKINTLTSPHSPKGSVGAIGDYAIVYETGSTTVENGSLWYKTAGNPNAGIPAGTWVHVGSTDWKKSIPTVIGASAFPGDLAGAQITINDITVTFASTIGATVTNINNAMGGTGITARDVNGKLYLYSDGANADGDSTFSERIRLVEVTSEALADSGLAPDGITAINYFAPRLHMAPHTDVPAFKATQTFVGRPTGSVWIKTTEPGGGARWRVRRWSSANQAWVAVDAPLYANGQSAIYFLDRSGGGSNIPLDSIYVQFNATEDQTRLEVPDGNDEDTEAPDETPALAQFRIFRRKTTAATSIISAAITTSNLTGGPFSFKISQTIPGSQNLTAETQVTFSGSAVALTASDNIASAINSAAYFDQSGNPVSNFVVASITDDNELVITHTAGGDIRFVDTDGKLAGLFGGGYNSYTGAGTANWYAAPAGATEDFVASNWIPLSDTNNNGFAAKNTQPLEEPFDGQLWYNPEFSQVDIMVHDGTTWRGYRNVFPTTSPNGPIVSATAPLAASGQSDGTALVTGDLWISTADLENFPTMYRWDGELLEWILIDKTDQVTDEGVLFADARFGASGATGNTAASIADLTTSDYLDFDAPDPSLYPRGMLLWNLRRSGGNVKIYRNSYVDPGADNVRMGGESQAAYANAINASTVYDRWTTFSANNEDGSGAFGRKAVRKVVVAAMKSVIDTSEEIRDEERRNFNLIAAPGYPETLSNLINLNIDRGLTAFVIGDTPLRLRSDATTLINWGTNANLVFDNGDDGIVSFDEYCAVYYPNGFTTDLGGSNAVVPASHMMLRTIALSDQVSFPWFAPAGTRRGGITNATAVGYIDSLTGEFQTVALNEGTRDVLYDLKVNPIPFFVGVGLVAYGQKTRARNASALDRINVARLVVYLRSQLQKLARPYIFEPNDQITRDEIKGAVESLLLELVGLRALYDFAVVCDESNNTPSRVDRNELYVDIAIEPVKAVEFIYIPLRIKNTGEI